jgi:ribosomal protein S18 acetylase RimI-like enzyme
MDDIRIVDYDIQMKDRVRRLFKDIYPDSPEIVDRLCYDPAAPGHVVTRVACCGEDVVGQANIFFRGDLNGDANLGFHVHPSVRARGIATALSFETMKDASSKGVSVLFVRTKEDNFAAIVVAAKLGFAPDESELHQAGLAIFKKQLERQQIPVAQTEERQYLIRKALPDDAPAIARAHVDSWRSAYRGLLPDDRLARLDHLHMAKRFRETIATGSEDIYVAEETGTITGFLAVGPCRDRDTDQESAREIYALYLSPQFWRRGIGRGLCEKAEEILKSQGCSKALLWVFEDNRRARRFYEAMGFTADGSRKVLDMGAYVNAVRYQKPI